MKNINLYLIRHGQSVRNTMPDLIGQDPDDPLSSHGETQAKMLGRHFAIKGMNFERVFYSTYKRAHDTWKIAREHFDNSDEFGVSVNELREYSAGEMKDKSRKEIYGNPDLLAEMNELGMLFKFPKGESLYEVQQRSVTWLTQIALHPSVRQDGDSIALFTHGMVIKCLLQHFMKFDQKLTWRIKIDNTSVTSLSYANGLWHINYINNTEHLVGL